MSYFVRLGDTVQMHYTTRAPNGGVIETSYQREPLTFQVGSAEVLEGINRAVLGMHIHDHKTITLHPNDAFGFRETRWQQSIPRSMLPDRLQPGDQLGIQIAGRELDVWVRSLSDSDVVVDANHPLAGETLMYDLEVIDIPQRTTL